METFKEYTLITLMALLGSAQSFASMQPLEEGYFEGEEVVDFNGNKAERFLDAVQVMNTGNYERERDEVDEELDKEGAFGEDSREVESGPVVKTHTGERQPVLGMTKNQGKQRGQKRKHAENKGGYFCSECGYEGRDRFTLTGHMRTHSGETPFECEKCGEKFSFKSNCNQHIKKYHQEETVNIIDNRKRSDEIPEKRQGQKRKRAEATELFNCSFDGCGKSFEARHLLNRHKLKHIGVECTICGKSFARKDILTRHIQWRHKEEAKELLKRKKPAEDIARNKWHIESSVTSPSALSQVQEEASELPASAEMAEEEQIFNSLSADYPNDEQFTPHTGETPFVCGECGKVLTRNHDLKVHMRIHTKEQPYTCEECGRGFTQSCNLRRHEKMHAAKRVLGND